MSHDRHEHLGGTKARRRALRALLVAGQAATQAQLSAMLNERGFAVTQSTVSRDLKLLGALRRVSDSGELEYYLERLKVARFPAEMIVRVTNNETMLVVRTRIGRAPAVALELDALRHPEILGTIAGDDTVLVVPSSVTRIDALRRVLLELADLDDHVPPDGQ